jgi:Carbohydrate-selective porin, OprB family
MKRLHLKLLLCSCSIGLSWTIALPARSQTAAISNAEQKLSQVPSGSQRSDVPPPDWAVRALQSLADCPNRGDRNLNRSEFAVAINTCADKIQELTATTTADSAHRQDLATLKRLQAEFAAELATLRKRVDRLDASTTTLERQQFSSTVKLKGEVILAVSSIFSGDRAPGQPAARTPTVGDRIRLNLETSFSGRDLLTVRLQAGNFVPLGSSTVAGQGTGSLATNEGRLEFDGDNGNRFGLGLLRYRFPLDDRTNIYLAGAGNGFVDLDASAQLTPYFDGSAVSLFGLRNPIYNYSYGAGVGVKHQFNDLVELNLGYLVPDNVASKPAAENGLFNGQYGALAQVIFNFSPTTRLGLTYINAYSPFPNNLQPEDSFNLSATGSNLANSNFGRAVGINAYGATGTVKLNPNIALGGWVGYAEHQYVGLGKGQVWNWLVGVSFLDLLQPGSVGGLLVGMEPKLTAIDASVNGGRVDRDTSLHLEAFYKYRINDNLSITPGIIWLTAPNHDARNSGAVIGVVRTAFTF